MNDRCPICGSRSDQNVDGDNVYGGVSYCMSCVWDAMDGDFSTASKEQLEALYRLIMEETSDAT